MLITAISSHHSSHISPSLRRVRRGFPGEVSAGQVVNGKAFLRQQARGVIGALAALAGDYHRLACRDLAQAPPELGQRDVHAVRDAASLSFIAAPHIQDDEPIRFELGQLLRLDLLNCPFQHVAACHARQIDGVLGGAERRRVGKLEIGQIPDGHAGLHGRGDHVDALMGAILADHLRAQELPAFLAEEDLHRQPLRARIIAGMQERMNVDRLVCNPGCPKLLLVEPCRCDRQIEDPQDSGPECAVIGPSGAKYVVGHDTSLPVGGTTEGDAGPLLLTGCRTSMASPAAHTPAALVCRCSSTLIPPGEPMVNPAWRASAISGLIPRPGSTRSAGIGSWSPATTQTACGAAWLPFRQPGSLNSLIGLTSPSRTPCLRSSLWTSSAISGSRDART